MSFFWLSRGFASKKLNRNAGKRRYAAEFVPRLEALEDRRLLAAGWTPIGPAPDVNGNVGRIDVAAPDPQNQNVMYVGTNDGGIWKTTNWLAQPTNATTPNWTPLTDKPNILS